jgi:ribonucleoside-diphosphate reductase alpha chain
MPLAAGFPYTAKEVEQDGIALDDPEGALGRLAEQGGHGDQCLGQVACKVYKTMPARGCGTSS